MLKVQVINDSAQLNNYTILDIKQYLPNYPLTLKFQVLDVDLDLRLIAQTASKLNLTFQNSDGTELVKACALLFTPDDKSMWTVTLSAAETLNIVGTNVEMLMDFNGDSTQPDLSDGTILYPGMAYNMIQKLNFDGDC